MIFCIHELGLQEYWPTGTRSAATCLKYTMLEDKEMKDGNGFTVLKVSYLTLSLQNYYFIIWFSTFCTFYFYLNVLYFCVKVEWFFLTLLHYTFYFFVFLLRSSSSLLIMRFHFISFFFLLFFCASIIIYYLILFYFIPFVSLSQHFYFYFSNIMFFLFCL